MCEHISPAIYTSTASTANSTAIQPYRAMAPLLPSTITSRRIRQMYQKGTSASSALAAASTHDT